MSQTIRVIGVLICCTLFLNVVDAQDWPQWRGPNRDGNVVGFAAPKSWPKTLTQKWTAIVGSGVSSPVQVGEKLFAFGRSEGDEVTTCVNAITGKVEWQDRYPTSAVGGPASGYGGPRGTPAVSQNKIFTLGVNGTISCIDINTGKPLWRKETGEKPQFSTSMSPLVADGKCVVFLRDLTAFDVNSGDVIWKGPTGTPYGSPALMTVEGMKLIVTPTANSLAGVDLKDGKTVWSTKLPAGGYTVHYCTPIIDGQTIIYSSPSKGGAGSTMALKISKKGDEFATEEIWKSAGCYQYHTPTLKDGLLFGLSSSKNFFCMDAKTGTVLWTDETPRGEAGGILNAGSVIISLTGPAAAGGKGKGRGGESATGESELIAFEPSRSGYKELAKYKLSPGSGIAYPIVVGNRVYVKGNNDLSLWSLE